jgi:hypothetical protein
VSGSEARKELKTGDYEYAKVIALVEIAESLVKLANKEGNHGE